MRKIILPCLLLVLFCCPSRAQQPSSAPAGLPFILKPLGHNVYAAIDDPKGDAGANAGFVIGDNGVLVIDTFENEGAAKQMLAQIRKLTSLPIKYVVNTHYHLDHVAGNKIFADAGAVIIAHQNVAGWIHTENLKFFGKDIKPEQKSMVESLFVPDISYESALSLSLGSRTIYVGFAPGHTGGDSWVAIPDAQVVFWGDLFWHKTIPNLIDASTSDWIKTLGDFSEFAHSSGIDVPGHGDVGTNADVAEFRDYLGNLRNLVKKPVDAGKTGDELVNAVLPALTEKYGKWGLFEYFSRPNILDMAAELRGTKQIPVAQ
jgi:cyclase